MFFADLSSSDPSTLGAGSAAAVGASLLIGAVFFVGLLVVGMIPAFVIARKAGYNGWLSLLTLVPLVNIVILFVFAFADWPALRGARPLGFEAPPPFPQTPFPQQPFPTQPPSGSAPPPGGPPQPWG